MYITNNRKGLLTLSLNRRCPNTGHSLGLGVKLEPGLNVVDSKEYKDLNPKYLNELESVGVIKMGKVRPDADIKIPLLKAPGGDLSSYVKVTAV